MIDDVCMYVYVCTLLIYLLSSHEIKLSEERRELLHKILRLFSRRTDLYRGESTNATESSICTSVHVICS